jgi:DNA polymerase-3 subunit alpha
VASYGTIQGKGVIDEIGRHLAFQWEKSHPNNKGNPYSLADISRIKKEFDANKTVTRKKYPEIFYYYDGLLDTKVSQSVHPAGMVISPISLSENYGTFDKDGENCLMVDMEEAHEVGLAKYDFLVLKTVQVIRDTCRYVGNPYPKTNEINWQDNAVWDNIIKSPVGIFQFESAFAFNSLKKLKPQSIFDMSLVTASIRPAGSSYRDELLERKYHKNPSEIIDELLRDNLGYLIYQEDTIRFLQQICGLSGSEADNIRRAIGRKQKDRLEAALPSILEGYCNKSPKPRDESEREAKEFLQIIEDSADYQFGYNHSIAYCLLSYLCGYYRYYNPIEFITSFLNNAANDDDIQNGTILAKQKGIAIIQPKFGFSKSDYYYNKERNVIAKGLSSIKYMSKNAANELYKLSQNNKYDCFTDLLKDIKDQTSLDSRQLDILIKIDFFSDFGNQRELLAINDVFEMFKCGDAKQIKKERIDGTEYEEAVRKFSTGKTKDGKEAKSYTLTDTMAIIRTCEKKILSVKVPDLSALAKAKNYKDVMGYSGYVSGKEEDRNKLYVKEVYPVRRKKDNAVFGYSVVTQSIGSGKESRMTVFKKKYDEDPVNPEDFIVCKRWERDGIYFRMLNYEHLDSGNSENY